VPVCWARCAIVPKRFGHGGAPCPPPRDAGVVTEIERGAVLDALVDLVHAFHPNGDGPHFSGGTITTPKTRARSPDRGGRARPVGGGETVSGRAVRVTA
jgi:hypothetical protein